MEERGSRALDGDGKMTDLFQTSGSFRSDSPARFISFFFHETLKMSLCFNQLDCSGVFLITFFSSASIAFSYR